MFNKPILKTTCFMYDPCGQKPLKNKQFCYLKALKGLKMA